MPRNRIQNHLEEIKKIAALDTGLGLRVPVLLWKIGQPIYVRQNGIPCDPCGGCCLKPTPDQIIRAAEKNSKFYGGMGSWP